MNQLEETAVRSRRSEGACNGNEKGKDQKDQNFVNKNQPKTIFLFGLFLCKISMKIHKQKYF